MKNKKNIIDNMTNDFFEQIIINAPGYLYWKDLNSVYMGCNQNAAMVYGKSSPSELIGKTDFDFNQKFAAEFVRQDQYVITTGNTYISEKDIITQSDKELILRTEKKPLRNELGEIIGILGCAFDVTKDLEIQKLKIENIQYKAEKKAQEHFMKFVDGILQTIQNYKINIVNKKLGINKSTNDLGKIILTKREEQILYFLAMGKSPKEIACILGKLENKTISGVTINGMINKKLYPKFEVANYSQLIDKATRLGLIPFIPESLMDFFCKL